MLKFHEKHSNGQEFERFPLLIHNIQWELKPSYGMTPILLSKAYGVNYPRLK